MARADIVIPTEEFFREFYKHTHVFPRFIANEQNSFYRSWKPRNNDLLILPYEYSIMKKRKLLLKIATLRTRTFVILPNTVILTKLFQLNVVFHTNFNYPYFTCQRNCRASVVLFEGCALFN